MVAIGRQGQPPYLGAIMPALVNRRGFVAACAALGLPLDFSHQLWAEVAPDAVGDAMVAADPITKEQIAAAENVLGLSWRDKDRDLMLRTLQQNLSGYTALHAVPLPNSVPPAFYFDPVPAGKTPVGQPKSVPRAPKVMPPVKKPDNESDWAYAGVAKLSRLDSLAPGHVAPAGRAVAGTYRELHARTSLRHHADEGARARAG